MTIDPPDRGSGDTGESGHVGDWHPIGVRAAASGDVSPGARVYYDALRDRDIGYNAALRQLGNRLVGILHGCLKTHTPYNEALAWHQHTQQEAA